MVQVNVRDFGACGDGRTKDTAALQAAIDYCAAAGGGTVVLPSGAFLSGTLLLKSFVTLHLEASARLVSSLEKADFGLSLAQEANGPIAAQLSEGQGGEALLCARFAEKVAVTGQGTIDGQGERFLEPEEPGSDHVLLPLASFRPKLVDFEGCVDVLFRDVTLYRASSWGLHLTGCRRVNIHGITILGQQRGPNNDGIDPDSCRDVHISDCHVETGDDCIVIKTTAYAAARYGACENITVSNCTLVTHDSAIKIGTETHADIRNIVVQNCVIRDSNRGLGIWVRDGATVENVLFSNIAIETRLFSAEGEIDRPLRWWGKGEPIFITAEPRAGGGFPGRIRHIRFRQIEAESEGCVYLEGSEGAEIEDISIQGLTLRMRQKSFYPGGLFDTQPSARGVFPHPVPAMYVRFARNVALDDVQLAWEGPRNEHWTHALSGERVEELTLRRLRCAPAVEGAAAVTLTNVSGLTVEGCKALPETGVFLRLASAETETAFIAGNDFSRCEAALELDGGSAPAGLAAWNRMPGA